MKMNKGSANRAQLLSKQLKRQAGRQAGEARRVEAAKGVLSTGRVEGMQVRT